VELAVLLRVVALKVAVLRVVVLRDAADKVVQVVLKGKLPVVVGREKLLSEAGKVAPMERVRVLQLTSSIALWPTTRMVMGKSIRKSFPNVCNGSSSEPMLTRMVPSIRVKSKKWLKVFVIGQVVAIGQHVRVMKNDLVVPNDRRTTRPIRSFD
jgi:hypothetical protein